MQKHFYNYLIKIIIFFYKEKFFLNITLLYYWSNQLYKDDKIISFLIVL